VYIGISKNQFYAFFVLFTTPNLPFEGRNIFEVRSCTEDL